MPEALWVGYVGGGERATPMPRFIRLITNAATSFLINELKEANCVVWEGFVYSFYFIFGEYKLKWKPKNGNK